MVMGKMAILAIAQIEDEICEMRNKKVEFGFIEDKVRVSVKIRKSNKGLNEKQAILKAYGLGLDWDSRKTENGNLVLTPDLAKVERIEQVIDRLEPLEESAKEKRQGMMRTRGILR